MLIIDGPAQERIAAAIRAAEARTSGEIVCTLDAAPHRYVEWLLALSAALAFTIPPVATLLGFGPERWAAILGIWRDAPLSDVQVVELMVGAQLLTLSLVTPLLWWSPFRQRWVPLPLRRDRVHEIALHEFLARGVHLTAGRTGVLIHVSVEDHVAEVVADGAIWDRVTPDCWAETLDLLLDGLRRGDPAGGYEAAIARAGALLAEHFPPGPRAVDELPNRLILL